MRSQQRAALLTATALSLIGAGAGGAASQAAGSGPSNPFAVTITKPPPAVVRIGQAVLITGRVRGAPARASALLEVRRTAGWQISARAALTRRGAFRLLWRLGRSTQTGPAQWRVAVLGPEQRLGATRPVQLGIGPAYIPCVPAVPPAVNIPVGYGWIAGGVYVRGGAFPGVDECSAQPYTISAYSGSGGRTASQDVAAHHSYTLVVPAGSYTLQSSPLACRGTATVTAGRQTTADTYCDVP